MAMRKRIRLHHVRKMHGISKKTLEFRPRERAYMLEGSGVCTGKKGVSMRS
jgi:hypothetical protein